jgi:hypothetical protein
MRFWVDSTTTLSAPWPRPYIRGWEDLIYASFAPGNFALIDLRSHRISGRFSAEMASDAGYWNRVILPMMMSIISGSIGAVELHCACVAKGERGLLLSGPTRSGKSTLALALAFLGFGFLCDDRILCWRENCDLKAWTPVTDLKLRREAMAWFGDFTGNMVSPENAPEDDLRFEPRLLPGITRLRACQPRVILFLEHTESVQFELTGMSQNEAERRLAREMPAESLKVAEYQSSIIGMLSRIPCYQLRHGGSPWTVAKRIIVCFRRWESRPACRKYSSADTERIAGPPELGPHCDSRGVDSEPPSRVDAIGRFLPAAYRDVFEVLGKRVAVETNSIDMLQRMRRLFSMPPSSRTDPITFHWRIITQPDAEPMTPNYKRLAFSDPGLRFAQFGHRSFFAVDLKLRRAVAFVTEAMADDDVAFTTPFLDSLFCTCCATLGFLPLFSSSVAIDGQGILILGAPGSGKTTASYVLAKSGMQLVGDEGVFLERSGRTLRAWGGFWPIAFRADALQFFPELKGNTKPFAYHNFRYLHLEKNKILNSSSQSVTPVACVFLERAGSSPLRVSALEPLELFRQVGDSLLFEEDSCFRPHQQAILNRLARLPGYRIVYGVDPADAAAAIRKLLVRHMAGIQAMTTEWPVNKR